MLFNSFEFLAFFAAVYVLYLVLPHRRQNGLLIIASCIFYATLSWKFLLLMIASISTDYWCSRRIAGTEQPGERRGWLALSLGVNLAILGFFKYYNFFVHNLEDVFHFFSLAPKALHWELNIFLPVGISFYTFEAMSYVMDVYRRQAKPADRYWDYLLFVIYFPHMIAGPIMRTNNFLPQIMSPRRPTPGLFYEGAYLFLWGLFEKVFIADNLSTFVDPVFLSGPYEGGTVMLALYAFAFQILCDFDGYSNMARGMGKCMGFDITINFKQPYFSSNPREFWQRWHISLSSWLRDYVYIPLGGNRGGLTRTYANLFGTMLLAGLWHGANWKFVMWGAYWGGLLVGHRALESQCPNLARSFWWVPQDIRKCVSVLCFFQLTCLGWLFFRAQSLSQAVTMLKAVVSPVSWHTWRDYQSFELPAFAILISIVMGLFQYRSNDQLILLKWPWWIRTACYTGGYILLVCFGALGAKTFIYFQF